VAPLVDAYGTDRRSPLLPGRFLVHADLHNHTWLSDGAGDPAAAFGVMRRSGLDVAALTDHAKLDTPFTAVGGRLARQLVGIDRVAWRRLGQLADLAQEDGAFVAIRGFEWSHPTLGHVCVWGSDHFVSPFSTPTRGMGPLYDFMERSASAVDALASFNHPGGRRTRRFADFEFRAQLRPRLVGLEMFNKTDDYLFAGVPAGRESPLVHCLRRGWRPGLLGVSDEHGDDWGTPEGKGRTGLYVDALTRSAVWEALLARRGFASRVKGLRLAVTAGGVPMGGTVRHRRGPLTFAVDVDLGPSSLREQLSVQVLRPGPRVPVIAAVHDLPTTAANQPVSFPVELNADDGDWVVVRVSDPVTDAAPGTPPDYAALGSSLAYASPIWLDAS
jgi:hypothetical protein